MEDAKTAPTISILDKCEVLAAHYQGCHDEERADQGLGFLVDGLKELRGREEERLAKGVLIMLQEGKIKGMSNSHEKAIELLTDLMTFTDSARTLHSRSTDLLKVCGQDDEEVFFEAFRAFEDFVVKHYS